MNRNTLAFYFAMTVASSSATLSISYARETRNAQTCPAVVGLLATYFVDGTPNSQLARVEVRQCSPEEGLDLLLDAWQSGRSAFPLIIDTGDQIVIQAMARENIFVVETTGGSRDRVYVIEYEAGKPKLRLQGSTKATAELTTSEHEDAVDLFIPEFLPADGGGPRRTEHFHLKLSHQAMEAPKETLAPPEVPKESNQPVLAKMRTDDVPFAVKIASVEYPPLAEALGISGTVVLRVRVDKEGVVSNVRALSGPFLLLVASEDNIKQWKFSAARSRKLKVDSEFGLTYNFKLNGISHTPPPVFGANIRVPG